MIGRHSNGSRMSCGPDPCVRPELWAEALTHGSMGEARNYERLEFLGDRVLGLAIAEWLHERGVMSEGTLSQRLNALVSGRTCATVAREIGLPAHLRLGKQARDDGGLDSDNILGDVVEAFTAHRLHRVAPDLGNGDRHFGASSRSSPAYRALRRDATPGVWMVELRPSRAGPRWAMLRHVGSIRTRLDLLQVAR